jgi:hypothetical protein
VLWFDYDPLVVIVRALIIVIKNGTWKPRDLIHQSYVQYAGNEFGGLLEAHSIEFFIIGNAVNHILVISAPKTLGIKLSAWYREDQTNLDFVQA